MQQTVFHAIQYNCVSYSTLTHCIVLYETQLYNCFIQYNTPLFVFTLHPRYRSVHTAKQHCVDGE